MATHSTRFFTGQRTLGNWCVDFFLSKLNQQRRVANTEAFDIGNAWAAAGMMRVWAIINRSSFSTQMQGQKNNLTQWIDEILTGVWRYQVRCSFLGIRIHLTKRFALSKVTGRS